MKIQLKGIKDKGTHPPPAPLEPKIYKQYWNCTWTFAASPTPV